MGIILSYLTGNTNTGRTDDPDPVTGLTSRDRYILSTTWTKLSSGSANLETGIAIFLNLFEKQPQYQQLFPFRDIPRDELKNNSRFKAHCVTVMYGLSSIINNIETPLVLEQLLLKQGVSHAPRNVPRKAYEELNQVLIALFAKSMNPEELATWGKFLDLGVAIMEKGADSVNVKN